jgi:hypothetical protein
VEKLFFVFRRQPGATRADFFDHYLTVHSPLGLKHKDGLAAYTVNLLDSPAEFDALTEIWTPKIAEFMGPGSNSGEGAAAIIADHRSFMGPQDTYAVEERVVRDGPLTSPLGAVSPGVKVATFHNCGEALPEPSPGAHRVVDNVAQRPILLGDRMVDEASGLTSDLAVIRTSWAASLDDLGPLPAGAVAVSEYRWRTA